MKFLILDIETNGIGSFRPPGQRPIQVSFQLVDEKGAILIDYSEFIKGVIKIQWGGSIGECPWTVDFVNSNGVSLKSCIRALKAAVDENTIIIGHNIEFDVSTLMKAHFSKTIFTTPKFCTMKSTVEYCKLSKPGPASKFKGHKWPKLFELANKLDIAFDIDKFHDSKYDVEITKECFLTLLKVGHLSIKNKKLSINQPRMGSKSYTIHHTS